MNSTRPGNKQIMPRSDKPTFLQPGMLARGRGKKLNELYTSKCKYPDSSKRVNHSSGHSGISAGIKKSGRSFVPHSSIGASSSARDPFNPFMTGHQLFSYSSASDHDDEDIDNEDINGEDDAIASSEDEDLDLHNPRYTNVLDLQLEEHTDETHSPQIGEEMNINANEAETLQIGKERNSNGKNDSKKRKICEKAGKTRGRNKCKEIARLKPGDKLPVQFYNNRAVGVNQGAFVRHLGIIVRDTNICPLRVHKWKDIGDKDLDHMWRAVTDVFSNDDMESYREHVLLHIYDLWTNWRSDLKRYNITKPKRTLRQALDHVPSGLQKEEWHWLITEIYSKDPHKKASARNSANRANYKKERLHRTGSKPYRQVAWELGASSGNEPSFLQMYRETHKKGSDLATPEIAQKYDEIRDTMEKEPSLSHMEVAQKVFKSKSRDSVIGYGGGVKAKEIRGPSCTRVELEVELNATRKNNEVLVDRVTTVETENENLRNRVVSFEAEMGKFKDWVSKQLNITIPSSSNIENGNAAT